MQSRCDLFACLVCRVESPYFQGKEEKLGSGNFEVGEEEEEIVQLFRHRRIDVPLRKGAEFGVLERGRLSKVVGDSAAWGGGGGAGVIKRGVSFREVILVRLTRPDLELEVSTPSWLPPGVWHCPVKKGGCRAKPSLSALACKCGTWRCLVCDEILPSGVTACYNCGLKKHWCPTEMVEWSWGGFEEAFSQFLLGRRGQTVVEEEPSFVGDRLVGDSLEPWEGVSLLKVAGNPSGVARGIKSIGGSSAVVVKRVKLVGRTHPWVSRVSLEERMAEKRGVWFNKQKEEVRRSLSLQASSLLDQFEQMVGKQRSCTKFLHMVDEWASVLADYRQFVVEYRDFLQGALRVDHAAVRCGGCGVLRDPTAADNLSGVACCGDDKCVRLVH